MLSQLVKGIGIGLGAAVPIGQVNVEIARRTLRGGFGRGFAVGAGACTIDVGYAVLTTVGVGSFMTQPAVRNVLSVTAVFVLTYIGLQCVRAGLSVRPAVVDDGTAAVLPRAGRAGYVTGLAMTASNPMTIAFWFFTVPGAVGSVRASDLAFVAVGVFVGTIAWVLFFAGTLSQVRRFDTGGWMRAADVLGGSTLLVFAVVTFLRSIGLVL